MVVYVIKQLWHLPHWLSTHIRLDSVAGVIVKKLIGKVTSRQRFLPLFCGFFLLLLFFIFILILKVLSYAGSILNNR